MSGPNEPQDQSGNAEGQEPTQQWAPPGSAAQGATPTQAFDASAAGQAQQWGQQPGAGPQPGQAQPQWGQSAQGQWGQQPQAGQQQWGQPGAPAAGQQWGQQPAQGQWGQQPQAGQQQWGQPQAGQQWGQPQPGQAQPGQPWGQPQPGQQQPKSKKPLILGLGALAVVVILAIIGVVVVTSLGSKTLDAAAAESGVEKVLTQSYGATEVDDVSCPDGQKVESGNSFECTVTVDGQHRSVTLTFTDDEGTYEVSRPN